MPTKTPTPEISVHDLISRLGAPNAPLIIDVRLPEDAGAIPHCPPGAIRVTHTEVLSLASHRPEASIAVLCHKGLKLSQGAAAMLRAAGRSASAIAGGAVAWRDAGASVMALANAPISDRWTAACRPDIETLAALWLVRRWITAEAMTLFVQSDQTHAVADRFSTEVLPIHSPFDAVRRRFGLESAALDAMAARLLSLSDICAGFQAMHDDDLNVLEAALPVFDALFAMERAR